MQHSVIDFSYDEAGDVEFSTMGAAVAARELVPPRESEPSDVGLLLIALKEFFKSLVSEHETRDPDKMVVLFLQHFAGCSLQIPVDEFVEQIRKGLSAAEIVATRAQPYQRLISLGNHYDLKPKDSVLLAGKFLDLWHRMNVDVVKQVAEASAKLEADILAKVEAEEAEKAARLAGTTKETPQG